MRAISVIRDITDIIPSPGESCFLKKKHRKIAGVGFAAVMKLLGHTSPDMTMHYVDVTLTDLQREFQLARSQPRHLAPQPKTSRPPVRAGLDGLIDSLLATQHVIEMVRRCLLDSEQRTRLNRLVNRLTKILTETCKLRNN